jgi:hypothetical protein
MSLLRAIIEATKELIAFLRVEAEREPPPPEAKTPKEVADYDIQTFKNAVTSCEADDIMRLFNKLRDDTMGAVADVHRPAAGTGSSNTRGQGDKGS